MKACILGLACALLLAPSAAAALMPNAPPEEVVRHAHVVVRGKVDHDAKTVQVVKAYGGATAPARIEVVNLRKFGSAGAIWESEERRRELAKSWPSHAILFLAEIDGRYWLVDTSSPSWVPAHASIKYVRDDGKLLGYHQTINPGPLNLIEEETTLAEIEAAIPRWLKERPAAAPRRPPLEGEERAAFWDLVSPWIDFYTRKIVRSPRPGTQLSDTVAAFRAFAAGREGEARKRGVEALLILGKSKGTEVPPRRRAVQAALAGLAKALPRDALEPALLAELASVDVFAAKELAGRTLVRMGTESAAKGREILLPLVASPDGTLASRAYWTLKVMGFHAAAEEALERNR